MRNLYSFSRYLTLLALLLVSVVGWSQSRTITGKITDEGSPIPGVNILEKGTNNGTTTDATGSYSISVGENATLVVSFIGYKTQEIAVGSQTIIDLPLESDVTALTEVVVIGYGEINRKDATSAVATIKASEFNRGIISSPEQLIQGKTAGVQITSSSGEPGAGVNLRIRGTSSVYGGNNPLFVVDGIPLVSGDVSGGGSDFGRGTGSAKNPLNFINPNDIESIDILKDASATAIYGSRGANGVVIITTKSGKGKKHVLEYTSTISFSKQRKKFDLLDRDQYLDTYSKFNDAATVKAQDRGANTDWQDQINRTSFSKNNNLSYSNNYNGGNYRASISYDDQEGIIKNSDLKRMTGRLNLNQNFLKDKLKFGAQMLFSKVNDQAAPITNNPGNEGDLIGSVIQYNPTAPADATQIKGDIVSNPIAMLRYTKDFTETKRNLLNFSLGYDITKDLNFKVNTGFDRSTSFRENSYSSQLRSISSVTSVNGRAFTNELKNNSDLLEAYLTYKKTFTNSTLNVVGGYSYQQFRYAGHSVAGSGFTDQSHRGMIDDLTSADQLASAWIPYDVQEYGYQGNTLLQTYQITPDAIATNYTADPNTNYRGLPTIPIGSVVGINTSNRDVLESFFGRVKYSLKEKYMASASFRVDGSTRFGKNYQRGYFPAVSLAWRLSEEDFVPTIFDDLKVRVGYGVTGNQNIPHNLHDARQRFSNLTINNDGTISPQGTVIVAQQNNNLKWEQTSQLNAGLDFGFFGGRLNGTLDFYNKNTTDLLIQVSVAQPAATPFFWRNLPANVINKGIELNLNGVVVDKQDLGVNLGFNIAYNKNIVKNYNSSPLVTGAINGQGLTNATAERIANNQPLFTYYVRNFSGFAADGKNKKEEDTNSFIGKSPLPKVSLGFSLSVRYKGFDLSTYLTGQYGFYIYNNVTNAFFTKGSIASGKNVRTDVVNSTESPANSPDVSTRFLEKGNFLRLQTATLGYSFNLTDKNYIKKLRLSVTGQNLFVITKYSGLDPEVNVDKNLNNVPSLGIDYTSYPRARTVSFTLGATF